MKEVLIGKKIDYLDKGYVTLVDVLGSDELICAAARQSFDNAGKQKTDSQNQGLINYLTEHLHLSPQEMPKLVFEIKMPIFVMRQHVRHRQANLNEQSLRYSEHSGEYYLPPVERFCKSHKWNKQGSGEPLSKHVAEACQQMYEASCEEQLSTYHKLLNAGVSKETARGVLGVSFYTKITWAMDLRNLFHYLGLRNEGHAQQEIQELAAIIENEFVAPLFPKSYAAYLEFTKGSETFSKTEADWLRGFLKRYAQSVPKELFEELGDTRPEEFTSERRWRQFLEKLKFTP